MAEWAELLTELVRTRGEALGRYGFLLCGDRGQASDLVQDALTRVFASPSRCRTAPEAEGYVRRAMVNRFLDLQRRRARLAKLMPRLACPDQTPDMSGSAVDRMDVLRALDQLTPRQRACVVLRFYEDLPVAGVAERMNVAEGTVKRHLSDALARMSTTLRVTHASPSRGEEERIQMSYVTACSTRPKWRDRRASTWSTSWAVSAGVALPGWLRPAGSASR